MTFDPPNGPLFTLRLDRPGFEALGQRLTDRLRYIEPNRIDLDTAASFCVFAAEWWRRNYEKGPWTWRGIQSALGIERVSHDHLRTWTDQGLRQLGRKPIQIGGSTRYLSTLAAEGGFPLKLVKRQGTYLHGLFSALFDHLDRTSQLEPSAEEVMAVAERRSTCLPRSLRQRPVFLLTGLLVARLWPLILEVRDQELPLVWLDREHPGWRDSLPIELDDADARAFMEGLVSVGAETLARRAEGFGIGCHMAEDPDTETWHLLRSFSAPPSIRLDEAAELLGEHQDSPSIRARLLGSSGDLVVAVLRRHATDVFVELLPGVRLRDDEGAVELELMSRNVAPSRVPVPGGLALGPLPWVFRRRRERWELHACGSCRVTDEVVRVALAEDSVVEDEVTEVGRLEVLGRRLLEVRGRLDVQTPEGSVRIECGVASPDPRGSFTWSGVLEPELRSGRAVYRGWPDLFEERANGARGRVDFEVKGPSGWGRPQDARFGEVMVRRVGRDGQLVFAQWLAVLPADLQVTHDVGNGQGTVGVASAHLRDAGLSVCPPVLVERQRSGGVFRFDVVVASGSAPAGLEMYLDFGGRPLTVRAPSPVAMSEIVGRHGRPLHDGESIHLGELGGVRVQVTEPRQRRHYVEAILLGTSIRRTFQVPATGEHTSELDLRTLQDELHALLAQSADLDASLDLRLVTPGGSGRGRRICVRRYDWIPDLDKSTGDVVLPEGLDGAVAEARPFAAILRKEELPRLRTGRLPGTRWEFGPQRRQPGAWLITVRDDTAWFRGRPTLWTVSGNLEQQGLLGAIHRSDPGHRKQEILASLDALANDLDHDDWVVLDSFLEACADLPAATFDVARLLVGHRVLPLAILRLTWREPQLRLRILAALEALPTCWMLIPCSLWFDAFDRWRASAEDDGGSGLDAVVEVVTELRGSVDLSDIAFAWCQDRDLKAPDALGQGCRMAALEVGRAAASDCLGRSVASLLHRHLLDQWPEPALPAPSTNLRVRHAIPPYAEGVVQAPVAAAQRVVGDRLLPPSELAATFKLIHDFDPIYFRECWNVALALALTLA